MREYGPYFDEQLTWDPRSPAPYESGWSLLSKVMLINHLSSTDLYKLICKEDTGLPRRGALDHLQSNWINFKKLETLLGVETVRLEQCFLDTLGFPSTTGWNTGIRHCPECAPLGYHSVLFSFAIVENCPWHNRLLEPMCPGCLRFIAYSRPKAARRSLEFRCEKCDFGKMDFSQSLCFDNLKSDLKLEIDKVSSALVEWWQLLGKKMPERDMLLSDIWAVANDSMPYTHTAKQWQMMSYAHSRHPLPQRWTKEIELTQVKRISWNEEDAKAEHNELTMRQLVLCYKSVRRYIFSRYVRQHRKCYKFLYQCDRPESQSLDSDQACSISLAYLAWRVSFEGWFTIENLRAPDTFRDDLSIFWLTLQDLQGPRSMGNLFLGAFYQLLRRIEDECDYRSFYIKTLEYYGDNDFKLLMSPNILVRNSSRTELDNERSWWLLFPDPDPLAQRAHARCCRRGKLKDMIHADLYWGSVDFEWTGQLALRNRLFKLKHETLSRYDTVSV